jgi:hypothetical protein
MKEKKRFKKETKNKRRKEYMHVCECAPEAPQLAGDGDGVLANGGIGVAACMGTCEQLLCIYARVCMCLFVFVFVFVYVCVCVCMCVCV